MRPTWLRTADGVPSTPGETKCSSSIFIVSFWMNCDTIFTGPGTSRLRSRPGATSLSSSKPSTLSKPSPSQKNRNDRSRSRTQSPTCDGR